MAKISLGLPVYNGERYLEQCLTSIVNQTFQDFELVISDNASTDRTMQIIESFADKDRRIRVIRQPENVGAARNFNLLVEETKADVFKWCAHDDRLEPRYLEETYAALQAAPNAVLCHTYTVLHDLDRAQSSVFVPEFDMSLEDRVARLHEMFAHGQLCYEVFGLIRREALEQTKLIGNYRGGDNVLLARLALLGAFVVVPLPSFVLGLHETQSTVLVNNSQAYHAWFTGRDQKVGAPDWIFLIETWRIGAGLAMPIGERIRFYGELSRETYRRRYSLRRNIRVAAETAVFGNSNPLRRRRLFGS